MQVDTRLRLITALGGNLIGRGGRLLPGLVMTRGRGTRNGN